MIIVMKYGYYEVTKLSYHRDSSDTKIELWYIDAKGFECNEKFGVSTNFTITYEKKVFKDIHKFYDFIITEFIMTKDLFDNIALAQDGFYFTKPVDTPQEFFNMITLTHRVFPKSVQCPCYLHAHILCKLWYFDERVGEDIFSFDMLLEAIRNRVSVINIVYVTPRNFTNNVLYSITLSPKLVSYVIKQAFVWGIL